MRTVEGSEVNQVKKLLIISAVVLLALAITAGGIYMHILNMIENPHSAGDYPIKIEVPKGTTPKGIASILIYHDLIKSERVFLWEVKREKLGTQLQAGYYIFEEPLNMPDVIHKLITEGGRMPPQRYTFLEGLTIEKYASALKKREEIDSQEYLEIATSGWRNLSFKFADEIPEGASLEGYLFPQTYLIEEPSAKKIVQTQLRHFENVFKQEYVDKCKAMYLTIHECVTLASIVEAEAGATAEMPIVASVFWNRLDDGWTLDCNATLAYSLGIDGYLLSTKQLKIDDPYNTYKYKGLPPGPICSPSENAINAVLYPADTDYFFFVAKGDGTSAFSKTLTEHERNIRKYLR
jgi:UPF0755 protein